MTSADRLRLLVDSAFADLPTGALVLAAVSGGGDSVALLHLLVRGPARRGVRIGVAHLDHRLPWDPELRRFVEALCARLGLPCWADDLDVRALARARGGGFEEAGRTARRAFFERVAEREGAFAVALGHTLDDRAETLLLHLARGAGAGGLCGLRSGDRFRRPLLSVRRSDLRRYLTELGEPFRDDPSNDDLRFARNRVRVQILPALRQLNPRVEEALARAATILADEDDYLEQQAAGLAPTGSSSVAAREIDALPRALARRAGLRLLRGICGFKEDLGHEHVDALLGLAHGVRAGLATDLPGGWRLVQHGGRIRIVPVGGHVPEAGTTDTPLVVPGETYVPGHGMVIRIDTPDGKRCPASGLRVEVSLRALGPRPMIRRPRAGDRFTPLGGPGSRPLLRYLADRKVSRERRRGAALLVAGEDILWVVGHQVSEAARFADGDESLVVQATERTA